ncbi:MAG: hypothetical protein E6235_01000 [Anaerococcus vaginalis]|uniref:hypothetical protein n=1 Tax=Anaerococcus vaginalis TaxID=33037 RepID=UPI00291350C7|nr:hypothetical protein [Anaerococcus vaginalis]MDU5085606.1 hypothetical protein [Anaerococcus vaginalis]
MQEFYSNLVKDKLKRYIYAQGFIIKANERINELINNKTLAFDNNNPHNELIGDIDSSSIDDEIDMLRTNIKENKSIIEEIDCAFNNISEAYKDITLVIYGMPYKSNKIQALNDRYHYSKAHLYNIANDTLVHLSLSLFGNY